MKTGKLFFIANSLFFVLIASCFFSESNLTAADTLPEAKNVIVFIGDGMGFSSDLAGTYYRYGESGKQRYHSFPIAIACTTFSMLKKGEAIPEDCKGYDPEVFWASLSGGTHGTGFTRTTDSAAASTAFFSGQKTLPGKIGISSEDKPLELISEIAARSGKKVGSVTTVPLSHATPAGFAAHCGARGQMDGIFLQQASKDSPLAVLIGAGNPIYDGGKAIKVKENEKEKDRTKRFLAVGGEKTWAELQKGSYNGFTVVQKADEFNNLATKQGTIPEKLIGIPYANTHLVPADGYLDDIPETKKFRDRAYQNRDWNELPSLATLTLAAINVLTNKNEKGFLLLVEGGAIDGANHGQKIDRNCMEHTGFSKAIDAAIDWVEKNSSWEETLIVITADHETGQIWGPDTYSDDNQNDVFDEGDSFDQFYPIENNGRGEIPTVQYAAKSHSNALVPFWAKGPGSELFLKRIKGNDKKAAEFWKFSGDYIDNTDLFPVLKAIIQ